MRAVPVLIMGLVFSFGITETASAREFIDPSDEVECIEGDFNALTICYKPLVRGDVICILRKVSGSYYHALCGEFPIFDIGTSSLSIPNCQGMLHRHDPWYNRCVQRFLDQGFTCVARDYQGYRIHAYCARYIY